VDRQVAEVGEGRVAGAEVVDREPDAEGRQPAQGGLCCARRLEHAGLGELEAEPVRGEIRAFEREVHERQEARVGQLQRGDVDAELDAWTAVPAGPPAGGPARLGQQRRAERDDQAGHLGGADQLGGGHRTELGVGPAHEGFEANEPAGVERHDRLVGEVQLPERGRQLTGATDEPPQADLEQRLPIARARSSGE
jgi:hypothetical protein